MSTLEILIVEDDPINLLIAKKLLEKRYTISSVTNGHEALEIVSNQHFDVILMDINLGDETLDGVDVMKKIRCNLNITKTKIYAVTSYALPDDRERFLNEGFDEYFPKPINLKSIIAKIDDDYPRI